VPDVIVVGGGVIGCAVAWSVAKAGASVTLVERDTIGAHASSVAAGMLAPLTEAAIPSGREGEKKQAFVDLALRSLALFPAFVRELHEATGIDAECVINGMLRVAQTPERAISLHDRFLWLDTLEQRVGWLDPFAIREIEPAISSVDAAILSPNEGYVRSDRLVRALGIAATKAGAKVIEGTRVSGVVHEGDRVVGVRTDDGELLSDQVVIAAGPWGELVEELGCALPIVPERGQLLTLQTSERLLQHAVFGDACYLVPRQDGTVIVGATAEEVGYKSEATAGAVGKLLEAAISLCPALAGAAFVETRAGLRPKTPDRLPVLGALPGWRGISVAMGHFRNGVLLSAITARIMADLLLEGRTEMSLEAFSPSRFLV
jgi:glycine oxidase